jgi:alpha-beta hydrolase superfamily lysophospholipase
MEETGVTVVLVHGAWADGSSWSKVIAELRSQGVRAVAADLAGG